MKISEFKIFEGICIETLSVIELIHRELTKEPIEKDQKEFGLPYELRTVISKSSVYLEIKATSYISIRHIIPEQQQQQQLLFEGIKIISRSGYPGIVSITLVGSPLDTREVEIHRPDMAREVLLQVVKLARINARARNESNKAEAAHKEWILEKNKISSESLIRKMKQLNSPIDDCHPQ